MIKLDSKSIVAIREERQLSMQEAHRFVLKRTLSQMTSEATTLNELRPVLLTLIELLSNA